MPAARPYRAHGVIIARPWAKNNMVLYKNIKNVPPRRAGAEQEFQSTAARQSKCLVSDMAALYTSIRFFQWELLPWPYVSLNCAGL